MQKFIVLGRKPDNSVEMLASPSVEFGKQKDVLHKNTRNEKFEEVQMFMLQPHTRAFHPAAAMKMEADIKASEESAAKEAVEAKKRASDEAAAALEAAKNETQTEQPRTDTLAHKLFALDMKPFIAIVKEFQKTNPNFVAPTGKIETINALIEAGYKQ